MMPSLKQLSEDTLTANLSGKNFLIVGGTKGIGAAIVKSLNSRGARVYFTGRSTNQELSTKENTVFIHSDLGTVKGAKELGEKLKATGVPFDTVVFCVGIITRSALTRNDEGIEEDLATSYLSRFFLVKYIVENNLLTGRKRVFIYGYPGQNVQPTNIEDINFEITPYRQWPAHTNTVVFNEALVYEAQRRYAQQAKFFGVNPGLIQTGIRDNLHGGKESSYFGWLVETLIGWFNWNTEQYSERTMIHLLGAGAEVDALAPISFDQKGEKLARQGWTANEENCKKVWEKSEALIKKAFG